MFGSPLRAAGVLRAPHGLCVRHQSTKTAALNRTKGVKSAVAAKVGQKAQKGDYNALSNHNMARQETPGAQTQTETGSGKAKVKKDYSALPRVPSTNHLTSQKVAIDSFYAGYRPLAMQGLKQNLLPTRKKSLFGLGLEDEPVWLYSAAGLGVFEEWERVPFKHYKDLVPFKPPMTEEQKDPKEDATSKTGTEGTGGKAVLSTESTPAPPKTRRGRLRPNGIKLQKKRKN